MLISTRYIFAMLLSDSLFLHSLIERLGRLAASEGWAHGLNPSQTAALDYLARANRFSRAPSQVADYLGATRGTVSQTLLSLERKGLIGARPSSSDRRSLCYDVLPKSQMGTKESPLDQVLAALAPAEASALALGLHQVLSAVLKQRGGRAFGLCRDCRHHEVRGPAAFCQLLKQHLQPAEAEQICYEQAAV